MEPRYYDALGHVNHEALAAYAAELRREAIDEFWSELRSSLTAMWRKPRRGYAGASTSAAAGLARVRHR